MNSRGIECSLARTIKVSLFYLLDYISPARISNYGDWENKVSIELGLKFHIIHDKLQKMNDYFFKYMIHSNVVYFLFIDVSVLTDFFPFF